MKWFSSLITIVLFLAILVMPTFAEDVKPVMARPVSIGGKSIKSIEPLTPDGKWAISQAKKLYVDLTGKTVEYTLIITEEAIDLAGAKFPVWAFGKEGEKGTVPGPTIGAVQGDFVRVIVKNKSQSNHTLRLHGPLTIRYGMSGVPDVAQEPIRPGEQFVYEFVAYPAGTHIYYGHANTNEPMNKGLYGPLIILPKQAGSDLPEEWAKINRDVVLMLDEWNSAFFKGEEAKSAMAGQQTSKRMAGYNFTINGNVFTDERPTMLSVKRGERIRVRLINMGELSHTMYLPGHSLLITHIDGYSAPAPQRLDTVSITPGQRIDLVFEANQEGRWIWQCHTASHAMSDDGHRRGMLLMVAYPDGLDLAKFPLSKPTKLSE